MAPRMEALVSLQRLQIPAIELLQQEFDVPLHAGFGHESAVALGGQGETRGHPHAGVDQFAQGGALAPDQGTQNSCRHSSNQQSSGEPVVNAPPTCRTTPAAAMMTAAPSNLANDGNDAGGAIHAQHHSQT